MSENANARDEMENAGLGGVKAVGGGSPPPRKSRGRGFNAWWEDRSLSQKILVMIGFAILGIGFLALIGLVVMLLWNWLMPDIFGLKRLDFWQAWGLLILSWLLFRGVGTGNSGGRSDRKRKRQLRSYMQEEVSPGEEPAGSSAESPG